MDPTSTPAATSAAPAGTVKTQARRDLSFALRYGHRYGLRMSRFYGRISQLLKFLELLLGSAAAVAFFAGHPDLSMASGLTLAIISAFNISVDPGARAAVALVGAEKYGNALANSPRQTDDELEVTVLQLQAAPLPEIEALREPVWRDVVEELGLALPSKDMSASQKLFAMIA